jgi:leader peptidase (prepilin peptidase)/N-methyltransferase
MTVGGGQMAPLWLVMAVTVAGVPVGLLLSRRLATGEYRLDDEMQEPPPRFGWLVVVAVPVVWGLLAWRVGGLSRGAVLPTYLLLAAVGVALFWVDVDVHRLPEALTLPCIPAVALLLAIASATTGDWGALARALACGAGAWLVYLVLAVALPGGLGLGDATLGGLVSLPLGYLAWAAPVVGFVAAYLLSGVVALVGLALRRIHLKSDIAFGPFILIGSLVALFVRFEMLGL